jgi:hypothetical protein
MASKFNEPAIEKVYYRAKFMTLFVFSGIMLAITAATQITQGHIEWNTGPRTLYYVFFIAAALAIVGIAFWASLIPAMSGAIRDLKRDRPVHVSWPWLIGCILLGPGAALIPAFAFSETYGHYRKSANDRPEMSEWLMAAGFLLRWTAFFVGMFFLILGIGTGQSKGFATALPFFGIWFISSAHRVKRRKKPKTPNATER